MSIELKEKPKTRSKVERPKLHKVIILNDDYTPRHFVVRVLQAVFRIDHPDGPTAAVQGADLTASWTKRALERLGAELDPLRYRVVRADALTYLRRTKAKSFDIVFSDPPFEQRRLPELAQRLTDTTCLHADSLWYLEAGEPLMPLLQETPWRLIREQRAGQVHFGLAQRAAAS